MAAVQSAFSVGFGGSLDDLEQILDASSAISSVYTGGIAGVLAGGRPQYASSLKDLEELASFAHSRKVSFEITLNAPCGIEDRSDKTWWTKIRSYLKDLEARGVDAVTVSHPFIINEVKSSTGMRVCVSTICEIVNARGALYYESMGGDVITPSMNINMDLEELARIRNALPHATLRIMVNEHCLGDCPWRRFHHNHYAHSNRETDYHLHCKAMYLRQPYLFLTNNTIRPEDLHHYEGITREFKIVGRMAPVEVTIKRLKAYENRSFQGNFVELSDADLSRRINIPNKALDGLIEQKWTCDNLCSQCGICEALFKQSGTLSQDRDGPPATAFSGGSSHNE